MARKTFSLIGGRVARLTRLDGCGAPDYGDRSRIVFKGFVSIAATAEIDEGEAVEVRNANGDLCAERKAKPKHKGYTVEITFCGAHPDAVNFTTASPLVLNGIGDVAGFDVDMEVDGSQSGFATEVWAEEGEGDGCSPSGDIGFGYVLLPFLQGGVVGDFTIENDAINFVVSNATSKKGHSWGTGPYLIDVNEEDEPVTLAALSPSIALRVVEVHLTPPDESEGAIPLDDPDAAAATGATAGTPGSFTPSGAYRPETVDDMTGVDASPDTAWTTGQGVMLQNGTFAHWDGDSWVAGKA